MVDDIVPTPHILASLEGLQRRIGEGMSRRVRAVSPALRGSHGRILNLIAPDGTRPTVLADGAWISKQAIGRRIQDMADRGLVTIAPDPADGRAVIVRRTAEGDRLMGFTRAQIADLEDELADTVGRDRFEVFRSVLAELAAGYLPIGYLPDAPRAADAGQKP